MKNSFKNSKVIFFDMGNTLIDFHKGKSDFEKDEIGINAISNFISSKYKNDVSNDFVRREFIDKWFAIMPHRKKILKEFPIDDFLDPFLEKLGLHFSTQEKIDLMILFDSGYQIELVVENNLHEILNTLQKKYRIGIISNSPSYPEVNIHHFEYLKLSQYIEQYIFSYSLKIAKPRIEIFKTACDQFKTSPEECIMIGDSLSADIEGAQKVKMKTIWLNSNKKNNFTETKPDLVIESLKELITIL